MRWPVLLLVALLLLVQYPLWFGKGGIFKVRELERQVAAQQGVNAKLRARNEQLEGEVRDLVKGQLAVEEHARYDLGMVKPDEVFVQIDPQPAR